MRVSPARAAVGLETVSVTVPIDAVEAFEQAFATACATVGFFEIDEAAGTWRVEGVRARGEGEAALMGAVAIAEVITGVAVTIERADVEAEGWLARTASAFPAQLVGRRFAVRGTHLPAFGAKGEAGRIGLTLDAGIAFGSGEHGSTQGCLLALEAVAHRRPRRILDMGCGSAILAMAASSLLHRKVLAVDIEPWSVRVAAQNARLNGLGRRVDARLGNGWRTEAVRLGRPFDLVFANILARPLMRMAPMLAGGLAPGGTAILAGLLGGQARAVLSAHRALGRGGLVLERRIDVGAWTTLVLRRAW
jgi:ribosomal protein L11 methyltransferase